MVPNGDATFYNAFVADGILPDTYGLRTVVEHRFHLISLPPQDSGPHDPSPDVIMANPPDDIMQSAPESANLQIPDALEAENTLRALGKYLEIGGLRALDPRYLSILKTEPPMLAIFPASAKFIEEDGVEADRSFIANLYRKALHVLDKHGKRPRIRPSLLSWHWADDLVAVATGANLDRLYAYNFRKTMWETTSDRMPTLGRIHCISFRPFSGRVLAIGCEAGFALLSGQNLSLLSSGSHADVISLDWSPDGFQLATASAADGTVRLWDIGSRTSIFVDRGCHVKFSPAQKPGFLFVGTTSPSFRLWSCESWTCERWGSLSGPVAACTWSSDGSTLLFSTENDSAIHVISVEVRGGEQGTQLVHTELTGLPREGPGGTPSILEIDPAGERLAVAYDVPHADQEGEVASLQDSMSIDEHRRYVVALYATQLTPGFRMSPVGYVSGPEKSGPVVALKFKPKCSGNLGALLACMWRSGDVSSTQMIFSSTR